MAGSVLVVVAPLSFASLVAAVWAVGVVSWRRTADLRLGTIPVERGPPGAGRAATSPSTWLAAAAGASAAGWGAQAVGRGSVLGWFLMGAGCFVAVTGCLGRVAAVEVTDLALVVRSSAGRAFTAAWNDCSELAPPRTPFGGWRIRTARGARTLMPSDLLGHEPALASLVVRAGLAFDGRRWVRPGGRVSPPA